MCLPKETLRNESMSRFHRNLNWFCTLVVCVLRSLKKRSWKCPPKIDFTFFVRLEVTHLENKTVLHSTYNIKNFCSTLIFATPPLLLASLIVLKVLIR